MIKGIVYFIKVTWSLIGDCYTDLVKVYSLAIFSLIAPYFLSISVLNKYIEPYADFVKLILVLVAFIYTFYKLLNERHKYLNRNNDVDKTKDD
jgi:hypothetical protein